MSGELRVGGIDAAEDLGRAVGQQLPGRGEPDTAADALQQLRAGRLLEPTEVVGDGRLRVVQLLRRCGDRARAGDGIDDPQPVDVQHPSTLSMDPNETWHWTNEPIERNIAACPPPPPAPPANCPSSSPVSGRPWSNEQAGPRPRSSSPSSCASPSPRRTS